ncbi:MAG: hypothetical protein GNW80_01225 [Asgard group archaeon]|nr:hypothetical protein [Asgard group archaeon]
MSSEDDVFLKTFTQMIEVLTKIDTTLDSLKKTVENIHLSIDGLGTGLTNINSQLTNLGNKVETLSTKVEKMPKQPTAEKVVKEKAKTTTKEVIADAAQYTTTTDAQHPIFVDLTKKINESEKFKEAGEILIEALEQIESSFSFSRVFYEIRRIGNGLIRKGDNDFQASDKQDLLEKAMDWETRLSA